MAGRPKEASGRGAAFRAMAAVLAIWILAHLAFQQSWDGGRDSVPVASPLSGKATKSVAAAPLADGNSGKEGSALPLGREDAAIQPASPPMASAEIFRLGKKAQTFDRGESFAGANEHAAADPYDNGGRKGASDVPPQPLPTLLALSSHLSLPSPAPPAAPVDVDKRESDHWSAYGYLYWRSGSGPVNIGARPSYGGSQFFTRISYHFGGHGSSSWLSAYLRYAAAVDVEGEAEYAAGVKIRPLSRLPIDIHAERRMRPYRSNANAVFLSAATGELPLPLDFRLDAYGQAGVVTGGGTGTLGFYDGQIDFERRLAGAKGGPKVGLGLKLSGGGQGSDWRLDAGPVVAATLPIANRLVTAEFGWREPIGGNVRPSGGAAFTLSGAF